MDNNYKQFGDNSIIEEPSRIFGAENISIGNHVFIGAFSWVQTVKEHCDRSFSPYLEIGDGCNIGRYSVISANNHIVIGKNVLMSERVYISDHIHEYTDVNQPIINQPPSTGGMVKIENDCWLGIGCCILKNVTIGRHSVVGANAVVTKDVPPFTVVAGNPARIVRRFDPVSGKWRKPGCWGKIHSLLVAKVLPTEFSKGIQKP